ncbi:MAG TPA: hypothetical protein PKY85_08980, partial [Nitrosomonas sp.]|nr:hypothetical protein [Nitrosomonas sp.]
MRSLLLSDSFLVIATRRGAGHIASLPGYVLAFFLCLVVFVSQAHASSQTADNSKFDFSKVPPVTPMPRPG